MRLILLPALGADERIFSCLDELPGELVLPLLPVPTPLDSMGTYASRLAATLAVKEADLIGGVSFGGMVAAEIARQQDVKGLVLISSGLSSRSIDPLAQRFARLALNFPVKMVRAILGSKKTFKKVFGNDQPPLHRLAEQMLHDTPDELLIQGGRLSLSYFSDEPVKCPVHAIHGEQDSMMFPAEVADCRIVPGAGQGMVVTHAAVVAAFLKEVLSGGPDPQQHAEA